MSLIFDCHTHLAEPHHLSGSFLADARKAWGAGFALKSSPDDHRQAMKQCSGAVVLALDAPYIGFNVPNEFVAQYVAEDRTRLFGFASVDPNRPGSDRLL